MSYNNPYQSYGQPPSYGQTGQYGPPPVDPMKINAPALVAQIWLSAKTGMA